MTKSSFAYRPEHTKVKMEVVENECSSKISSLSTKKVLFCLQLLKVIIRKCNVKVIYKKWYKNQLQKNPVLFKFF